MNSIERRISERIPAIIECHCYNIECFGTITNISENGMFIRSQKISFPLEYIFKISIPLQEKILIVDVKVNRITKTDDCYDGIGVELLNPSHKYNEFISSLKVPLKS